MSLFTSSSPIPTEVTHVVTVKPYYSGPFSKPWEDNDVTINVEGQKLHVHSFVLKMASPVFKTMLSCDMKEAQTKEIELKVKKLDDVVLMLKALYPQYQASLIGCLSISQLNTLQGFSQEYMIDSLKPIIEHQADWIIINCELNKDLNWRKDVLSLLTFADEHDFKLNIGKCIKVFAKFCKGIFPTSNGFIKADDIDHLSSPTKLKFCAEMLKVRYEQQGDSNQLRQVINYMANIDL